jgi:hypothetical protein
MNDTEEQPMDRLARVMREMHTAWTDAGFTDEQAFALTLEWWRSNKNYDPTKRRR